MLLPALLASGPARTSCTILTPLRDLTKVGALELPVKIQESRPRPRTMTPGLRSRGLLSCVFQRPPVGLHTGKFGKCLFNFLAGWIASYPYSPSFLGRQASQSLSISASASKSTDGFYALLWTRHSDLNAPHHYFCHLILCYQFPKKRPEHVFPPYVTVVEWRTKLQEE